MSMQFLAKIQKSEVAIHLADNKSNTLQFIFLQF